MAKKRTYRAYEPMRGQRDRRATVKSENPDMPLLYTNLNGTRLQVTEGKVPGDVLLTFLKGTKFTVALSSMTADELVVFREMVNHAVEIALPRSKALDEMTEEQGNEASGDVVQRLHRAVPEVFVRDGAVLKHDARIRERLAGATAVVSGAHSGRRNRAGVGPMAHADPREHGATDDSTED